MNKKKCKPLLLAIQHCYSKHHTTILCIKLWQIHEAIRVDSTFNVRYDMKMMNVENDTAGASAICAHKPCNTMRHTDVERWDSSSSNVYMNAIHICFKPICFRYIVGNRYIHVKSVHFGLILASSTSVDIMYMLFSFALSVFFLFLFFRQVFTLLRVYIGNSLLLY